eukprot:TRINITY_DN47129_c0_g1_i1.p1 TRINITY_DN47129_c0_g1~~TRINITY_DN47129_c0_g1_i1.p1  ORF type:complete len:631 (+),score=136.82 TRINITY_DN47129_c0_g1_i1:288-2180(+)
MGNRGCTPHHCCVAQRGPSSEVLSKAHIEQGHILLDRGKRLVSIKGCVTNVYNLDSWNTIALGPATSLSKGTHKKTHTLDFILKIKKAAPAGWRCSYCSHWNIITSDELLCNMCGHSDGKPEAKVHGPNFESVVTDFLNELRRLDHPNINRVYSAFKASDSLSLVTEFCVGIPVAEIRLKHPALATESWTAITAKQMLSAVYHLHRNEVVHGDLRPESWYFAERFPGHSHAHGNGSNQVQVESLLPVTLKLCEFGSFWRFRNEEDDYLLRNHIAISRAPEQFDEAWQLDAAADIWALGVIVFYLLSGMEPFHRGASCLTYILNAEFSFIPSEDWYGISQDAKDFVKSCLVASPAARPSSQGLIEHPWMTKAKRDFDAIFEKETKEKEELLKNHKMLGNNQHQTSLHPEAFLERFEAVSRFNPLQRAAITAAAHRLPADRITQLRILFEKLDTNSDGQLSVAELYEGMAMNQNISVPDFERLVQAVNTDGSNMIEYTEFIAGAYDFNRDLSSSTIHSIFEIFDKDHHEKVKVSDFANVFGSMKANEPETFKAIKAELELMDEDHNGYITYDEFRKYFLRGDPKHHHEHHHEHGHHGHHRHHHGHHGHNGHNGHDEHKSHGHGKKHHGHKSP